MKHWHRCDRWTNKKIACPFSSLAQHEGIREPFAPEPEDEGEPWPKPPVLAPEKAKPKRGAGRTGLLAGAADVPSIDEMLREIMEDLERRGLKPVPEGDPVIPPVGPVPKRPPVGPPAPLPGRSPAPARAPAPALARVPAPAAAHAVRRVMSSVPKGLRSTVRQPLRGPGEGLRGARGRMAGLTAVRAAGLAEMAVAQSLSRGRRERGGGTYRRAVAGAVAVGAGGAGAYLAMRGRGGGSGGYFFNASRRMRQLVYGAGFR